MQTKKSSPLLKLFSATAICAGLFSMPAHADIKWNGVAFNGPTWNGVTLNGLTLNGVASNGRMFNGRSLQGRMLNGRMLQGRGFNGRAWQGLQFNGTAIQPSSASDLQASEVVAVMLPDGKTVALR